MDKSVFIKKRKSFIEIGKIYFWTATIHHWEKLLLGDTYKNEIIHSLQFLSDSGKIDVFAFVIMPNHLHLIWRINELNGKETAQGSFLKFTAHKFKKMLQKDNIEALQKFKVIAENKNFEFWQRDSLAIELYTEKVAFQKLLYIHLNPCTEHWNLVKDPCDYYFSSAKFYEMSIKQFEFLKDLRKEF
jgi:putative transposase